MLQFPIFSTSYSFSDLYFCALHLLPDFKLPLLYVQVIPPFVAYSLLICNFINTLCFIFLFFLHLFYFPSYIITCTFVSYLFAYWHILTFFISCSYYVRLLISPDSAFSSSLLPDLMSSPDSAISSSLPPVLMSSPDSAFSSSLPPVLMSSPDSAFSSSLPPVLMSSPDSAFSSSLPPVLMSSPDSAFSSSLPPVLMSPPDSTFSSSLPPVTIYSCEKICIRNCPYIRLAHIQAA
jgi:hypothetical protein